MISTSVITSASAAEIWRIWTDVEHSPIWDTDVAWSSLDGPFFVGTRGAFKLKEGPKLSFVLDQVAYQQHYSNTVKLPGIALTFSHHIEPLSAQEIRITHGAVIRGPVGFMLAPLLKLKLRKALTDSLQRMVALAVIDQV
jgi:hypothetical protein